MAGIVPAPRKVQFETQNKVTGGDLADEESLASNTLKRRSFEQRDRRTNRRHTVGGAEVEETMRQHKTTQQRMQQHSVLVQQKQEPEDLYKEERALFLDHLASKFPDHADKIKGPAGQKVYDKNGHKTTTNAPQRPVSVEPLPVRPSSVEPQRRQMPSAVKYNPNGEPGNRGYGDEAMMSETETEATGGFRRGGMYRSSLPIVRDPSRAHDRSTGMLFLIYRGETKRAWLPGQINHSDVIKTLFVRSFPADLNMKMLDGNRKRIYVLNPTTNMYTPLQDLRAIRDRTVLKLVEPEDDRSSQPRPHHQTQEDTSYLSEPELDSMRVRRPPPKSVSYQGFLPKGQTSRPPPSPAQRPPPSPAQSDYLTYDQIQHMYNEQRQKLQQESLQPRRPASTQPFSRPSPGNYTQQRTTTPQPHTAYSPREVVPSGISSVPASPSISHDQGRASHNDQPTDPYARNRMAKMEAQIANLTAWVEHASQSGSRPSSRAASEISSHSPRSKKSSIMFSRSSVSSQTVYTEEGISEASTPQPMVSMEMQNTIKLLSNKSKEMKLECRNLKRIQQAQSESMREMVKDVFLKIQGALVVTPSGSSEPIRAQRFRVTEHATVFRQDQLRIEKELGDLEASVEEVRGDVINRHCRVNMSDVETMALALSHISKALAELKGGFSVLQDEMKSVMEGEMEIVVQEERFLREEPDLIDDSLRKCKKLTGTLFTLKRLASVQEHRTPQVPNLETKSDLDDEDKNALLTSIRAVVPNHRARLSSIEVADQSRERKKSLLANQETKKFEKSLELASKILRDKRALEEQENRDKLANEKQAEESGIAVTSSESEDTSTSDDNESRDVAPAENVQEEVSKCNSHDDVSFIDEVKEVDENKIKIGETDTMKRRKKDVLPSGEKMGKVITLTVTTKTGNQATADIIAETKLNAKNARAAFFDTTGVIKETSIDNDLKSSDSSPSTPTNEWPHRLGNSIDRPITTILPSQKKETEFPAFTETSTCTRTSAFQRLNPGSSHRGSPGRPTNLGTSGVQRGSEVNGSGFKIQSLNRRIPAERDENQLIPTKDMTPERDINIKKGYYSDANHNEQFNNRTDLNRNRQPPPVPVRQSSSSTDGNTSHRNGVSDLESNRAGGTSLQEQSRKLQMLQREHSLKRRPKVGGSIGGQQLVTSSGQKISYTDIMVTRPRPTRPVTETCVDDPDDLL